MRRASPLLLVLVLVLLPKEAFARVRIKWDCYLPSGTVDCAVVESSLTSKIPFLVPVSSEKSADVVVTVTSVPAEDATRVEFDFVGRSVDGYRTTVHTTDKIPTAIDATTALVRVMTKLERGLASFLDQKVAGEAKRGRLTLALADPIDTPFTGRPEQSSKTWYVVPSLGSYFSDVAGVGVNAWGSASISLNVSGRSWRLQQALGGSYTRESQPVPGTPETATIDFASAWANNVLSQDLTRDHRLSVALLLAGEKNPQANYRMRANASAGIEYDLVPRQTSNQRNFGFRCAIGAEAQLYDVANREGLTQQAVPRELCDVFFTWHFRPIDLSANLSETIALESIDYTSFSARLGATWRVTDNLLVEPWVSLQEIVEAINEAEPVSVAYPDPKDEIEASMRAAVQQAYTAPFGVQSGLTVKYVFGNGSLASEDQRWKGVSSLR